MSNGDVWIRIVNIHSIGRFRSKISCLKWQRTNTNREMFINKICFCFSCSYLCILSPLHTSRIYKIVCVVMLITFHYTNDFDVTTPAQINNRLFVLVRLEHWRVDVVHPCWMLNFGKKKMLCWQLNCNVLTVSMPQSWSTRRDTLSISVVQATSWQEQRSACISTACFNSDFRRRGGSIIFGGINCCKRSTSRERDASPFPSLFHKDKAHE